MVPTFINRDRPTSRAVTIKFADDAGWRSARKSQVPSSNHQRSSKLPKAKCSPQDHWCLDIGASLGFGYWDLGFPEQTDGSQVNRTKTVTASQCRRSLLSVGIRSRRQHV